MFRPNYNSNMRGMQNSQPRPSVSETDEEPVRPEKVPGDCVPETYPSSGQMTDSLGRPVPNDSNSLTVGVGGPVLLEDVHLIDKLAHFDRERIPERVVHAKGAGAFGVFKTTASMSEYTTMNLFQRPGQRTRVLTRFSTVIGGRGSADTVRDPRGFAVKFYTEQGIFDLVGNDLPVFFIRDAIKFPDVIHSLKPSPDSNLRDPCRFWDFASLTPEATHMITWLYSDRGTIKDYRHIDGFGVNTFVWVNSESRRRFVKFHWKTMQGLETISRQEADSLAGSDPDIAVRLLREAIDRGDFPRWELCVQLMTEEEAETQSFDPLDDTKTWPEDTFPLKKVGVLTLDKNPDSFFAQIEQAAFCPANIVPGLEFSADKMLQGRAFSYLDAQRYRIGPNFAQLPVNRSVSPVVNNQRDGAMNITFNPAPVNYSPNSLAGGQPFPASIPVPAPTHASGAVARQSIAKTDDFTQAGEHFRSLSERERAALSDTIAAELHRCRPDIIERMLRYFEKADRDLSVSVARDIGRYKKQG